MTSGETGCLAVGEGMSRAEAGTEHLRFKPRTPALVSLSWREGGASPGVLPL